MMIMRLKHKFSALVATLPFARKNECLFCNSKIRYFLPYAGGWKKQPRLVSLLNVIGSDVDHFSCPVCGTHDRERHLRMYMDKLKITCKVNNATVLHFAPERMLSLYIAKQKPALYIKADLFPSSKDIVKINMINIPYEENYFDFVIANHVLEHVNNLSKALSELRRVLKVGGYAILQTPFSNKLQHTLEDKGIDSDSMRREVYGQEDHVRLFGTDIFELITNTGFISRITTHADTLSDKDARYWGVNSLEPFFLFEKI